MAHAMTRPVVHARAPAAGADTSTSGVRPRRRPPWLGFAPAVLVFLVALAGPYLTPYPATKVVGPISAPPDAKFWMGTDSAGLDVFSQLMAGARTDIVMASVVVLLATSAGAVLGMFIGMNEASPGALGVVGRFLSRVLDFVQALPFVIIGLVAVALYGANVVTLILAASLVLVPLQTRLVRIEVLRVRTEAYLDAARMAGLGEFALMMRHVLPNSARPALENATVVFGVSITLIAALGFLGVALPPPAPEWGSMISRGATDAAVGKWWAAGFPTLALALTMWSVVEASKAAFGWRRAMGSSDRSTATVAKPKPAFMLLLGLLVLILALAAFRNVAGRRVGITHSAPPGVLLVAVAALPTSLAFDDRASGYENMEYNNETSAKLIRYRYVRDDRIGGHQDVSSFEPFLASSFERSADGLHYTFHLRKGVPSLAGHELTADDVVWSFQRKWNSASVTPIMFKGVINTADQVVKLDRYTVRFDIPRASEGPLLLGILCTVGSDIYDSTYLKPHASASDPYAVAWSGQHGNFGFGAYRLKVLKPGQELILAANDRYVLGAPKIKEVIERVIPDPGMRANLLVNRDIDAAVQLRPADIIDLAKRRDMRTYNIPTNNVLALTTNVLDPPFNDVAVRRAFQFAIPYDHIVNDVYKGRAHVMVGLVNPTYPYASDGLPPRVYDPALAKRMLAQAGYTKPVKFTLIVSNAIPDLREVFLQLQTYAAAAGFDVSAQIVPPPGLSYALSSGKFQAYISRDMAVTQSPAYELLNLLEPKSPANHSHWTNSRYYQIVEEGRQFSDPFSPQAGAKWREAQLLWRDESPYVNIATVEPLAAFASDVSGFAHRSDNTVDYSILRKN
jgi:peptide/nickel transport system substrate-binding protein